MLIKLNYISTYAEKSNKMKIYSWKTIIEPTKRICFFFCCLLFIFQTYYSTKVVSHNPIILSIIIKPVINGNGTLLSCFHFSWRPCIFQIKNFSWEDFPNSIYYLDLPFYKIIKMESLNTQF